MCRAPSWTPACVAAQQLERGSAGNSSEHVCSTGGHVGRLQYAEHLATAREEVDVHDAAARVASVGTPSQPFASRLRR